MNAEPVPTFSSRHSPRLKRSTACIGTKAVRLAAFFLFISVSANSGEPAASATNRIHAVNTAFEEFSREWQAQVTGTNDWSVKLKQQPGWTNILQASGAELRAQADQGIALAELKLAYACFAGEGGEPDFDAGVKWLKKTHEFAPAQFLLGLAYLRGLGVAEDFAAGVECLNQAAREGLAAAQYELGISYLTGGPGANQAPERGFRWLELAAQQGLARAQQALGDCYALGVAVDTNPAEAETWYRRAARQGLASAQNCLAVCLLARSRQSGELAEAAEWFSRAATQGLALAQCQLARCYEAGEGVPADPSKAAQWWQAAADQGYPGAGFHLGLCYYTGEGRPHNPAKAADLFQADAERGHVGAQLYLGLCYAEGDGVPKDASLARKWWREAALQGISPARYLPGDGSLGDAAEIEHWWNDLAGRGNASLQSSLAEMYHYGHGVRQDEAKALRWYRLAAKAGDPPALKQAAWLLATSDDVHVRDGSAALDLALQADRATHHQDPLILDTLAAAYAEAGQFEKAVSTEKNALAAARRDEDRADFKSRLQLYEARTPFRSSRTPVAGF